LTVLKLNFMTNKQANSSESTSCTQFFSLSNQHLYLSKLMATKNIF